MRLTIAILLVLSGCPAAPRPAPTRSEVVVAHGMTFRARDGGAVDVSVTRAFAGQTATGAATLRGVDLEAAKRSRLTRVAVARAWLRLAALYADEPRTISEIARRGLDELGTDYRFKKRRIIDDTDNTLHIADELAAKGEEALAAQSRLRVLRSRVEIYLRYYRGQIE
jgi:hypothetical protein